MPCTKTQVETLERNGGRALVKAEVEEINIDATTGAATGVKLAGGATINAKKGVVSSAGYEITFQRLLKKAVVEKAGRCTLCLRMLVATVRGSLRSGSGG